MSSPLRRASILPHLSPLLPFRVPLYPTTEAYKKLEEVPNDIELWLPSLILEAQENRKDTDASIVPLQTPIPECCVGGGGSLLCAGVGLRRRGPPGHRAAPILRDGGGQRDHNALLGGELRKSSLRDGPRDGTLAVQNEAWPAREPRAAGVHWRALRETHESQSRLGDVTIGRSAAFAEIMTPHVKKYLGDQPAFTVENVRKVNQMVRPGFICVAADEACYPMHVIMLFEAERALMDGGAELVKVPQAWADKVRECFGIDTCGRDDIGCLEDVHWSVCGFGWFPGYAIGSVFEAQLMATIRGAVGNDTVDKCVRNGVMSPLLEEQRDKMWSVGSVCSPVMAVVVKATSEPLTTKYFRARLCASLLAQGGLRVPPLLSELALARSCACFLF